MTAENRPAPRLEKQTARPAVRASDGDRDRIADILREALAEGRLDGEEHAERIEQVYRAKTVPELEVLIADLPVGQKAQGARSTTPAPARGAPVTTRNVVAVLGGAARGGNWRVGRVVNVVAVCGGVELDLSEAVFESPQVTVNVTAVCGGVDIKVPANITLRSAGSGILGGFGVREVESTDPNAPVVVIRGVAFCGGVDAKAVPGRTVQDLRETED